MIAEEIKTPNILTEIDDLWQKIYADIHRNPPSRDVFNDLLSASEAKARAITNVALQPHLAIFEFGLEFLSYVHIALSRKDQALPADERSQAAWALTGAAVSFGNSIRLLAISGFDTPARALLRTYVETLFLCIAILHDPTLGKAYVAAQTDTQIKDFWHSKVSPKKLHERIIAIEESLGIDKETIDIMAKWRRSEYEILSQSSHLSYILSSLTVLTSDIENEDQFVPAIFGRASSQSRSTIFYAAATTWYFSRMTNPVLLGKNAQKCVIYFNQEDEWQQKLWVSCEIISKITLKYWDKMPNTKNV